VLAPAAAAQAPRADRAAVGTLIVAHGGGPEWNARVEEVAREVRLPGPVGVSFLMGPGAAAHRFQDVVRDLEARGAREIVVVPLLVSSHSGHYEQIAYLAGKRDTLDSTISAEDYAAWMSNLRRIADTVKARTGFRSVTVELVRDDAPPPVRAEAARVRVLITLQHELTRKPVVVVPVLVASGQISRQKLPRDIEGLPIVHSGEALLPHAGMARWVEARVEQLDSTP